ncbi:unnamed protein product [Protopolystoma xenopodis]|uniref:Amine oxidase domain-containing protein n=1 Tax=Protopolystoma xenopodis TaxID=117903 RepID=A0A3S5A3P5_9PLAT|nr:unnamed protein product [Protopolystoma xenopodis]
MSNLGHSQHHLSSLHNTSDDHIKSRTDVNEKNAILNYSPIWINETTPTDANLIYVEAVDVTDADASRKSRPVRVYAAPYCLVTLPVGVLKGLDKRSSVILSFDPSNVFWDRDAAIIKCPDPRLHLLNLDFYGQPGVLVAHVWAGSGLQLFGRSDDEIVSDLLNLFGGMYPSASQAGKISLLAAWVTRWSEDPFSLGAYTADGPECGDDDRHAYASSLPSEVFIL